MLGRMLLVIFFTPLSVGMACAADMDLCKAAPNIENQKLNAYPEKKMIISENVLMAVLSAIAYHDEGLGPYKIPDGWARTHSVKHQSGLFAAVFENEIEKHLVVAFRGTEAASLRDWTHNVLPFVKAQSNPATKGIQQEMLRRPDWRISATGHSLGGGLALEVSHRIKNISAVAFNPSPRIGTKRNGYGNSRVVFREKHEPLAVFRRNPSFHENWALRYEVLVDFTPGFFGARALTQHGIDSMAMNLLALSKNWSKDALMLYDANCNT